MRRRKPARSKRVSRTAGSAPSPRKRSGDGSDCMTTLSVNGKIYEVDVEPDTPLLWVLRDTIGLTGTRYGCGMAECGPLTVHIEGVPVSSCSIPICAVI